MKFNIFSEYLKHIIAKDNWKNRKNMAFRAKKRHFLTFFAFYSKRDFRVTTFFQIATPPSIMRLSTKSFRDMKTNASGLLNIEPDFWIFVGVFFDGGVTFFSPKFFSNAPEKKIRQKFKILALYLRAQKHYFSCREKILSINALLREE